jgi:F0F1-type ATP synthase membrane subunit b/b'
MVLLAFAESIQLFPDGTLFIHIALILIMIWVLNRTFFRPINRIIETREKQKGGYGSEAESILSDVSDKQATYNKGLLAARSEGYELIEEQRAAAISIRQEKIAAAKTETSTLLESEKQLVQNQASEAKAIIAREAEALAEKISSNILKA